MSNSRNFSNCLQFFAILLFFTCSSVISDPVYITLKAKNSRNARRAIFGSEQVEDTIYKTQDELRNLFEEPSSKIGVMFENHNRKKREHIIITQGLNNSASGQEDENSGKNSSLLKENDEKHVSSENRKSLSQLLAPIKEINNVRKYSSQGINHVGKRAKGFGMELRRKTPFSRRQGDQLMYTTHIPIQISDSPNAKQKKKNRKKYNKKVPSNKKSPSSKKKKSGGKQKSKGKYVNQTSEVINTFSKPIVQNYQKKSATIKHGMQINMFFRSGTQIKSRNNINAKFMNRNKSGAIHSNEKIQENNNATSVSLVEVTPNSDSPVIGEDDNEIRSLNASGAEILDGCNGKNQDPTNSEQETVLSDNYVNITVPEIKNSRINNSDNQNSLSGSSNHKDELNDSFITLRPTDPTWEDPHPRTRIIENSTREAYVVTDKQYKFTTVHAGYEGSVARNGEGSDKSVDTLNRNSSIKQTEGEKNSVVSSIQASEQVHILYTGENTSLPADVASIGEESSKRTPLSNAQEMQSSDIKGLRTEEVTEIPVDNMKFKNDSGSVVEVSSESLPLQNAISLDSGNINASQKGEVPERSGVGTFNLKDEDVTEVSPRNVEPSHAQSFENVHTNAMQIEEVTKKSVINNPNLQGNSANIAEGSSMSLEPSSIQAVESVNVTDSKTEEIAGEKSEKDDSNLQEVTEGSSRNVGPSHAQSFENVHTNAMQIEEVTEKSVMNNPNLQGDSANIAERSSLSLEPSSMQTVESVNVTDSKAEEITGEKSERDDSNLQDVTEGSSGNLDTSRGQDLQAIDVGVSQKAEATEKSVMNNPNLQVDSVNIAQGSSKSLELSSKQALESVNVTDSKKEEVTERIENNSNLQDAAANVKEGLLRSLLIRGEQNLESADSPVSQQQQDPQRLGVENINGHIQSDTVAEGLARNFVQERTQYFESTNAEASEQEGIVKISVESRGVKIENASLAEGSKIHEPSRNLETSVASNGELLEVTAVNKFQNEGIAMRLELGDVYGDGDEGDVLYNAEDEHASHLAVSFNEALEIAHVLARQDEEIVGRSGLDTKNGLVAGRAEVSDTNISSRETSNTKQEVSNQKEIASLSSLNEGNIEEESPSSVSLKIQKAATRTLVSHPVEGDDEGSISYLVSGITSESLHESGRNLAMVNEPGHNVSSNNEVSIRSDLNSDVNKKFTGNERALNLNESEESEEARDKISLRSAEDTAEFE